ncbi:hypothetical protein ACHMW5_13645 [Azospirillum melinis]|uniref:hypothetical protein n=1 Tax=Azospirillum melinis TaxID=328839 RepID=UPI003757F177
MSSIQVGDLFLYKALGYPVNVTSVDDGFIEARFLFGDGKCWVSIPSEKASDALIEYTPPEE